ncbi:hypothetical protein DPMN_049904 [Dreissena polymorpha]|uniref:Myb/SANT-like DNA-binding domain-containing protein n=1 Tax=Dreissena polymorpha TaxID=45954 RepID=A0A9D4CGJ2_DREPO|nr:hypothetical protein DPMN_049904 [Dreissena polymorpha]
MADMSSSQTSNSNNMNTAAKKRKRGPNYTASELAVLEEEFSANRSLLESNLSDKVTHAQLKHCWQQIADQVNSVGHHFRSGTEIKEKWRQMVKKAKKEFSSRRIPRKQVAEDLHVTRRPHHLESLRCTRTLLGFP